LAWYIFDRGITAYHDCSFNYRTSPFHYNVLFEKILAATPMQIPILSIAISLAVGRAAAYMISPFAGIIMSIAGYTGAKASQISVQWNRKYSIAFFFIGVVFSIV